MVDNSLNADSAGERVQSFLCDQTQQGNTYVPGKATKRSRVKRVKKAIKGVEKQFPSPSSAHGQAQGGQSGSPYQVNTNTVENGYTQYSGMPTDLNGVGQQFQGQGYQ